MEAIDRALAALSNLRLMMQSSEYRLHDAAAAEFAAAGIDFSKEKRLSGGGRIDFLLDGGVGVEIKRGKPDAKRLREQLNRYCASDEVECMIVLVERSCAVPREISGKRITLISLNALWGIAI